MSGTDGARRRRKKSSGRGDFAGPGAGCGGGMEAVRWTLSGDNGKATRESNGSDEGCEEIDGARCFQLLLLHGPQATVMNSS